MIVSGLLVTLGSPAEPALSRLRGDPRLTLGGVVGARLPIVAETHTPDESEELARELGAVPGVLFVDVVSVHFGGEDDGAP